MANAEAIAKANDKRIGAVEKKMDALEKATRAAGNFATLEKRVSTLESLVRALAASTKAGGGDKNQLQIGKDVEAMKKVLADNDKTISELKSQDPKDARARIEKLDKRGDMIAAGIKTLTARQEKHKQDQEKQMQEQAAAQKKIFDEQVKISQKMVKQAQDINKANLLEARLKRLEGQVLAALAK